MNPATAPEVHAEWATDGDGGVLFYNGWPRSGVLWFSVNDAAPWIAIRPRIWSRTCAPTATSRWGSTR
jgi:hypothetical protein